MIRTQNGATLAVTLLLLFVITLLGVSSIQVTQMQEKMASNLQDKDLSFFAAESALKAGETWLLAQGSEPTIYESCPAFPCVQDVYQNLDYAAQTPTWWQSNSAEFTTNQTNVTTHPRYIIEFLQFVPDSPQLGSSSVRSTGVYYYQITARGTGASNDSVTVLQTTAARRF